MRSENGTPRGGQKSPKQAIPSTPREKIDAFANAGLLTERQAEVYVYVRLEGHKREAVAQRLDVTESTVDDHLPIAEKKLERARATVDVLEALDAEE